MAAKKIAVTEQPAAKKIAVTEPVEEAPVKAASPPDEPVIKEEVKQEPLPDVPEPGPQKPKVAPRYESKSLDRLASGPRPLLHLDSHARGLARRAKYRSRAIGILGIVLVLVIVGAYMLMKPASSTNPLPQAVQQKADFTLYYPRSSTGEYKYLDGSSSYTGGKLTYNLGSSSGGPFIHVSEQALSVQPPDLHKLQNFSVFQAPAGEAAVGANGNILNGVLIANKTLVILNGLGGVSMQDFIQIINDMQP